MTNRDVTKSVVIISIAIGMGAMFVASTPAAFLASAQYSPPSREWKWENATVVVKHDLFIAPGESFEIRNSTVEMDSRWRTIGIRVLGVLIVEDSIIRSAGEEGYYFEVLGVAKIKDTVIEDVKSISPIGEGMIVSPMSFELKGSTLKGYDPHAVTFYFPWINTEDFIVESVVHGVVLVETYINVKNSTLGDLYFKHGAGEFHMWNCTYESATASPAAFGYIFSYRYVQIHTSLPESNLRIASWDEAMVDEVVTDDEGNFRMWHMSKWSIVDPVHGMQEFDSNPYTFEADKMVVREFRLPSRGARIDIISIQQAYYGITVQDIEENAIVKVHMKQV
jgi:hypothetical protein